MNFRDYVFRLLGLKKGKQQSASEIQKMEGTKSDKVTHDSNEPTLFINKVVIIATWFIVIASLLSLAAIILFEIFGKKSPSILSQLLLVMVGYLGGVIASYVRFVTPDKKTK